MWKPTLQSELDSGSCRRERELSSIDHSVSFISALLSGGDGRIAADPRTGLNKYLCPTVPTPDLICASSCTASPISVPGFDRAAAAFADIVRTSSPQSPRQRADQLTALTEAIQARLLRYFGISGLAQVFLCPSGTDALLTTAMLVAAERPGQAITAILPSASETGTGVPMAAVGRVFDGPDSGTPLIECAGKTIEISLRSVDGSPRPEDEVNNAFAAAATGNVIVFLTHSTKTGLIAPTSPPEGVNVIVDACQARIEPKTVAAYLRRGWPVVVTGSKFFGGPAFSGAVLFPRARLPAAGRHHPPRSDPTDAVRLGTALRWTAALAGLDAFEPLAADMAKALVGCAIAVKQALASNSALVPIDGLQPRGSGWADLPSILIFGVRDPVDRHRLLSAAELRPLYEHLGQAGLLLGQPVDLGPFGGLRLAFGARDLLEPSNRTLTRVFAMLEEATAPSRRSTQQNPWRARQFQKTSP